jgi:hypothetical protein
MTRKRPGTWTLLSKNQSKPHKMSSTSILWQSGRFPKNWPGCRKPCAIAHENRPKRTFSRKNKIRTRLARRPTLVVLCLKLWSVRGEGTVRVTKCVILASVWPSNFLLGKSTKRPIKGLQRGPYGPKINRNLIKCHLQVFCDNPGGFQKIGPTLVVLCLELWSARGGGTVRVTKCVILASVWASNFLLEKVTNWLVKGRFREKIKFEPIWPGDIPWWSYALNYGRYVEKAPFEWRNVSFWLPFEQVIFC